MDLKNAVAVCLISLFSATLVVLIVRSLDSRLEPQLVSIVEELRALRKQGGAAASPGIASSTETASDNLVVYYFHSNFRCPTCQSVESQANDIVHTDFASQLASGTIIWKVLNYEQPANAQLTKKFAIVAPVVVLARYKAGQVQDWKRLDKVMSLESNKSAFGEYVRDEIKPFIASDGQPKPEPPAMSQPALPVPDAKTFEPAVPKRLP